MVFPFFMKQKEKTAKARQKTETNAKIIKMYSTGRYNGLTPVKSGHVSKRGARKPKKKDYR